MNNIAVLVLLLLGVSSIQTTLHDNSLLDEIEAITEETPLHHLKDIAKEVLSLKQHVKELRHLSDRAHLIQKLSAIAFYQDFVINANLSDWSWLCHEFLTNDVNMTIYASNVTLNFVGCENVTKFYDITVSNLWSFVYHPYSNPWIEIFDNGTANTLVSSMNDAVQKTKQGLSSVWSFNYYSFGWVKTDAHGWRIERFDHLVTPTVPYQGEGWTEIPVPFTNLYSIILNQFPILGKEFEDEIAAAIASSGQPTPPKQTDTEGFGHLL